MPTLVRLRRSDSPYVGLRHSINDCIEGSDSMTKLLQAIRVASVVILLVLVAAGQTHLTNILTNGDFSKGLSCYNETAVGSPNYGPWLFYLSTDIDLTK